MRQGLLGLLVAVSLGLGTVVVGMAIADSRDPMPRAIVLEKPTDAPDPTAGLPRYRVVRVMDGDRLVVDAGGKELGVRLCGVDAPGLGQRLGAEAKAGLGG